MQKLVLKYRQESDVHGILVYGSMAKGTETPNSDIDLWIYREEGGFRHSIDKVDGIKLDLFEISLPMLEKFIVGREAPAINSLLEGKFLYNKGIDVETLTKMAVEAKKQEFIPIETMPKNRILNLLIQLKDLVDDARDLVDDKLRFRLLFSEVIVSIYNNLYDFFGIWRESPKNTLQIFEQQLPEIHPLLLTMLNDEEESLRQVESAEKILQIMAEKYGGIPESHVMTEIK